MSAIIHCKRKKIKKKKRKTYVCSTHHFFSVSFKIRKMVTNMDRYSHIVSLHIKIILHETINTNKDIIYGTFKLTKLTEHLASYFNN